MRLQEPPSSVMATTCAISLAAPEDPTSRRARESTTPGVRFEPVVKRHRPIQRMQGKKCATHWEAMIPSHRGRPPDWPEQAVRGVGTGRVASKLPTRLPPWAETGSRGSANFRPVAGSPLGGWQAPRSPRPRPTGSSRKCSAHRTRRPQRLASTNFRVPTYRRRVEILPSIRP